MKKAQELRVDEVSVQKFFFFLNHETILRLTSQLQQMQEQMNSMNDSGDFQDVESNYSGRLSHVSSQHAMIPSSRSFLSRDKRLSLDTWNSSGLQENVFGNQFSTFDSSRDHPQRIQSDDVQRELLSGNPCQGIHCAIPRETDLVLEVRRSKTMHTSDDRQNQDTIPMSTFATMTKALDETYNTDVIIAEIHGRTAKTANIGTAIGQIP